MVLVVCNVMNNKQEMIQLLLIHVEIAMVVEQPFRLATLITMVKLYVLIVMI